MITINKSENSTSGIYEIVNLINGKRYIGQTSNLYRRQYSHITKLNQNIHPNKHLQNAWNKYGKDAFEFQVLEYCSVDDLNERELYWINHYKSNTDGYNIRLDPNSNRGLQWSEKQRESMMAAINKENSYFKNHTVPRETMEKAWEASRKKVWTKEEREQHSKRLIGTKVKDKTNMYAAQTGEKNPSAKLSENEAKQVIYLLWNRFAPSLLAEIYHVRIETISAIKHLRSWKNISRSDVTADKNIRNAAFERINTYILNEL